MYVCLCIYVHMYVCHCMYVCISLYVRMYLIVCMYVCTMYICVYVCIHVCIYVPLYQETTLGSYFTITIYINY